MILSLPVDVLIVVSIRCDEVHRGHWRGRTCRVEVREWEVAAATGRGRKQRAQMVVSGRWHGRAEARGQAVVLTFCRRGYEHGRGQEGANASVKVRVNVEDVDVEMEMGKLEMEMPVRLSSTCD